MQSSEKELSEQRSALEQVAAERDSFRRQLEDIKTTIEYQVGLPTLKYRSEIG